MKKYIQINIEVNAQTEKEILIAELAELGFEGFEEERNSLKAYVNETAFNETGFESLIKNFSLKYSIAVIEDKNWNAIWEAGFEPVIVDDFCAVRADFHTPVENVEYEIIITPKMSFGTGHHATTYMMIQEMKQVDFKNKKVFDFGTGTGVLAILAEKMGAQRIIAIDNDEWSIENARENITRNNTECIQVVHQDRIPTSAQYDIVLANINKHVILQQMNAISEALAKEGAILFSGLLSEDETEVDEKAQSQGLLRINKIEKHNWICLKYVSKR